MMSKFLLGLGLMFCIAQPASAQITVIGNGIAKDCYYAVKHTKGARASDLKTCKKALEDLSLARKDRAATHVNIGILYMRDRRYDKSMGHFDTAKRLTENVPEIYINMGANYIYSGEYERAISVLNQGIELGTDKMPEALFNRAMAYDNLKQYTKAYKDLRAALKLREDWAPALLAIENYDVAPRPPQAPQG